MAGCEKSYPAIRRNQFVEKPYFQTVAKAVSNFIPYFSLSYTLFVFPIWYIAQ